MPELDGAVLEAPEVETGSPDQQIEPQVDDSIDQEPGSPDHDAEPLETTEGEEEPAEEDGEAEEDKETTSPDGRKMPDADKKAFAALKRVDPEAAKRIKGVYWANQDYRAAFPTVADATQAKTLIEEIGGTEGIQQIAQEREEWGTLDKQYAEGSGDFVKSIAEANPEAFVKIAPHVINEWQAKSPEQYAYFQNTLTVNTLKNAGIPEKLEQAYSAAGDNPQLQAAIAGIYNSIVDMHDKAQQFATKQQSVDPERQKFQQEKQQFEQQRRASFEEGVARQAETFLTDKMKPEIDRILAGRKIDDDAAGTIKTLVTQEIQKRLSEIPGFADKLEAFYRTGDAQKSIDYIKAQYNRLLPEATKKVVAPLYRNIAAPAAKVPVKPAASVPGVRSEVTLKEMPGWNEIDMQKTAQEYGDPTAAVMSGKAILKSGKRASGWI